jgi:hypothetical protein
MLQSAWYLGRQFLEGRTKTERRVTITFMNDACLSRLCSVIVHSIHKAVGSVNSKNKVLRSYIQKIRHFGLES